jgi:hypothetical protein
MTRMDGRWRLATDSEIRGRLLAVVYELRHANGGWVPISEINFAGLVPINHDAIRTVGDHLRQAGLIEWDPGLGSRAAGHARITGRGVDVVEKKVASSIDLVLPMGAPDLSVRVPPAEPWVGDTPFEIKVQNELDLEWQRFNNEWLFKWHALGYGGKVEVDAFDGQKIHYGGIKFGDQQQAVFWQAIGRYLNHKVHDYFKRWETETVVCLIILCKR